VSSETMILGTSAVLLALGACGVLVRRNPVAMLMSIELMLNAGNLLLVLAARVRGNVDGQAAALIVLVLAAAEAVIGLGLALALFRDRDLVDVDEPAEVHG
jgi:NADH-quinone oxidoreductase subunit K